jgi:hypothetical protein
MRLLLTSTHQPRLRAGSQQGPEPSRRAKDWLHVVCRSLLAQMAVWIKEAGLGLMARIAIGWQIGIRSMLDLNLLMSDSLWRIPLSLSLSLSSGPSLGEAEYYVPHRVKINILCNIFIWIHS